MGQYFKMSGVWSRLSGSLSRIRGPSRRGIQTSKTRKGGGGHGPDGFEGYDAAGGKVRMEPSWWKGKQIFDDFCMWGGLAIAPFAATCLLGRLKSLLFPMVPSP